MRSLGPATDEALFEFGLDALLTGIAARLEASQPGHSSSARRVRGHPPGQLLPRPRALGGVGVHDRAVPDDPAVLHEAAQQPHLERLGVVVLAAGAADSPPRSRRASHRSAMRSGTCTSTGPPPGGRAWPGPSRSARRARPPRRGARRAGRRGSASRRGPPARRRAAPGRRAPPGRRRPRRAGQPRRRPPRRPRAGSAAGRGRRARARRPPAPAEVQTAGERSQAGDLAPPGRRATSRRTRRGRARSPRAGSGVRPARAASETSLISTHHASSARSASMLRRVERRRHLRQPARRARGAPRVPDPRCAHRSIHCGGRSAWRPGGARPPWSPRPARRRTSRWRSSAVCRRRRHTGERSAEGGASRSAARPGAAVRGGAA